MDNVHIGRFRLPHNESRSSFVKTGAYKAKARQLPPRPQTLAYTAIMSLSVIDSAPIAAGMREILALLIARCQQTVSGVSEYGEWDLSPTKLLRTAQTIRRLIRAVIMFETMIYQAQVKAAMLADPAWRARVIENLGGWWALRDWTARRVAAVRRTQAFQNDKFKAAFIAGRARDGLGAQGGKPSPKRKDASPIKERRQFRLPPLERQFYGRIAIERDAAREAASRRYISPMSRPIEVTPYELTSPPQKPPPHTLSPLSRPPTTQPPSAPAHQEGNEDAATQTPATHKPP